LDEGMEEGEPREYGNQGTTPPKPHIGKKLILFGMKPRSILDIPSIEFARQMCIHDSQIFAEIKPRELLELVEKRKPSEESAITQISTRFNSFVAWLVTCVVKEASPKVRASILSKYIKIAQCCRKLNNFFGVQQIVCAFVSPAIVKLIEAKKRIATTEFQELNDLVHPRQNFKKYRTALRHATPPIIPYVGVITADCTFIADGNDTFVKNPEKARLITSEEVINFRKFYLAAEVIQDVIKCQQTKYCLTEVPSIKNFISNTGYCLTEEEAFQQSCKIQPQKYKYDVNSQKYKIEEK